jgi:HPr kinase/phosphorylase
MEEKTTPQSILDALSEELDLSVWSGADYTDKAFSHYSFSDDSATLVGFFNVIHANQAHVIGRIELNYLQKLKSGDRDQVYRNLFESDATVVVIFTDGLKPPEELNSIAMHHRIPVFCSSLSSSDVITHLRYFLAHQLSDRINLHGVFMEIISMGVLLTGESGLGKSELALELVSRGHRLIADDAPEFTRIAPDIILGSCPPILRDFLEVRGLGVLNIREMYGDSSIKTSKYLRLILHLTPMHSLSNGKDRLSSSLQFKEVLGLDIPVMELPVAPGRNLAVMAEAAVRNHLLSVKGYDAADIFIQRQRKYIEESSL